MLTPPIEDDDDYDEDDGDIYCPLRRRSAI